MPPSEIHVLFVYNYIPFSRFGRWNCDDRPFDCRDSGCEAAANKVVKDQRVVTVAR